MAKVGLRPLDDRVVVEPVEAEERTSGGIVLPDTAKERPQRGTVVSLGPGKLLDSGNRGTLSVAVGDVGQTVQLGFSLLAYEALGAARTAVFFGGVSFVPARPPTQLSG